MDDLLPIYDYCDQDGKQLAQKIRRPGKEFRWRQRKNGAQWVYNRKGIPHVLYNLPAIRDAKVVYVVEGEKDADTLRSHGLTAVCGENGAGPGKWRPEYTEQLRGKLVAVLYDNDDVGEAFAYETACALYGSAKSVRVVALDNVWPDIPAHGDITDLIEALGEDGLVKVRKLVRKTREYRPSIKSSHIDEKAPELISLDKVDSTPPQYFWEPYIRLNNLNIIRGDGGTGKTMFAIALMTAVASGLRPDAMPGQLKYKKVSSIYYGAEDEPGEYKYRVEMCGHTGELIHVVNEGTTLPTISHLDNIRSHIREYNAKLIVLDPIQSFLLSCFIPTQYP